MSATVPNVEPSPVTSALVPVTGAAAPLAQTDDPADIDEDTARHLVGVARRESSLVGGALMVPPAGFIAAVNSGLLTVPLHVALAVVFTTALGVPIVYALSGRAFARECASLGLTSGLTRQLRHRLFLSSSSGAVAAVRAPKDLSALQAAARSRPWRRRR